MTNNSTILTATIASVLIGDRFSTEGLRLEDKRYAIAQLKELPQKAGLYFLVNNETEEVLYIGISKNIWQRWKNHHIRHLVDENKMSLIVCLIDDDKFLAKEEIRLIKKYQPRLNLAHKNELMPKRVSKEEILYFKETALIVATEMLAYIFKKIEEQLLWEAEFFEDSKPDPIDAWEIVKCDFDAGALDIARRVNADPILDYLYTLEPEKIELNNANGFLTLKLETSVFESFF